MISPNFNCEQFLTLTRKDMQQRFFQTAFDQTWDLFGQASTGN